MTPYDDEFAFAPLPQGPYLLAQLNLARAVETLEHPRMARFLAELDALNAVADASPGFVWRHRSPAGGAANYVTLPDDSRMLVNLSVWTSVELLEAYTYGSGHRLMLRARREWFEPSNGPSYVLWWVPAGTRPTVDEGRRRLAMLAAHGPGPAAFTFPKRFPAGSMGRS